MNNEKTWSNRQQQRDREKGRDEGRERDERARERQGYRDDEWYDREGSGYNRDVSQSGYGSSMSSMAGGQGAYYPTEGGYIHDSRYADYGQDYRRYTENYYRHHPVSNWEMRHGESRKFIERESDIMQPRFGQSYESAYGERGVGDHMGYGEKGARYRDEFHGRYGAGDYARGEREREQRRSRSEYDRGYEESPGYNRGRERNRNVGGRSYFVDSNSDPYGHEENFWNIGNYGERSQNESGYGYGSGYDEWNDLEKNPRNYTW